MGVFDISGFGSPKKQELKINDSNISNYDFEKSELDSTLLDIEDINPLIVYKVINDRFSLRKLLENMGYNLFDGNIFCPFHLDEETGKPSARYHKDTDLLYCFSENRLYSAYHALKILYGKDINKIFSKIWKSLSKETRLKYLSSEEDKEDGKKNSEWDKYNQSVLVKFKDNKVNIKQYTHALGMVLDKLYYKKEMEEILS